MKHPNHRLIKSNRSYTVEEIAVLLDVHPNTVRHWIRDGLELVDERVPSLVEGCDLVAFLKARRASRKKPCADGEIYCVRCHEPRFPKDRRAVYQAIKPIVGNLVGCCPVCGARMFRRVNLARLPSVSRGLSVEMLEAREHISQCTQPFVNCDLE